MSISKLDKANTKKLLLSAEKMFEKAEKYGERRKGLIALNAFRELHEKNNPAYIFALQKLKRFPVTIEEFLDSKEFMGDQIEVWPSIRESVLEINPDLLAGNPNPKEVLFLGAAGCHAAGSPILMFDGSVKNVEDIKAGDKLMGPDSCSRNVLYTVSGRQTMYRITPYTGGKSFVVNEDHKLHLRYICKRTKGTGAKRECLPNVIEYKTMTVKEFLSCSKYEREKKYKLARFAVDFGNKDPSFDPYFFGLWLGDGTSENANITSMDPEIISYVKSYFLNHNYDTRIVKKPDNKAVTLAPTDGTVRLGKIKNELRKLNVLGNKHIPLEFKTATVDFRLAVLAGIIDTDGSLNCNGFTLSQVNKKLFDDIVFLARSLGFCVSENSFEINGTIYYKMHITGNVDIIPTKIIRKKASERKQIKNWTVSGFSIEKLEEDNYYGFELDEDHLYLDGQFTVHHNTAKSTRAILTTLYQVYLMDCFDWPQELFKLSKPTEIVFGFISIRPSTAVDVLYKPFKQYFEFMPYTRKYVEYDKEINSELRLSQNITIRPISANVNSLIGHAICGGVVDEINFFARVEKSKQTPDESTFDQAETIERTILNRRKSRFDSLGPAPGLICVSAQTRYKGDFTDRRVQQALRLGETDPSRGKDRVLFYREKRYDMNPKYDIVSDRFDILVGTDEYPTRIIELDSKYTLPPGAQIESVPLEFLDDFKRDPEFALREIVGIATNAITPFIPQRQKIHESTVAWNEGNRFLRWTEQENYKLNEPRKLNLKGMPEVIEANLPRDGKPRYVHVDLSVTSDRCGIGICHVEDYVSVNNERLPYYVVDWVVTLEPDSINQVDVAEVRRWVSDLKLKYNLNIARVSYDGFQSVESIQMLKKLGINALNISVDKTLEPYEIMRSALYTNRLALPDTEILKAELAGLELNMNANAGKGKVDHTPVMCFTGDTRVALADGTNPTFLELIERSKTGERFYVYSIDKNGNMSIKEAFNPRTSKIADKLVEITLDNWQVIKCTPEHLFMTLDGEWVQAQHLTSEIRLMPLYRSRYTGSGFAGYERVYCPGRKKKYMTHRLAVGIEEQSSDELIVHHIDGVKHNNNLENLQIMNREDHAKQHGYEMWEDKKIKMSEGHSTYYDNGGRDHQRVVIERLFREGKLKKGRPECSLEGCDSPSNARGLCDKHYQFHKRRGSLPDKNHAGNHRVLSVRHLDANEPVYDITVPETENFALTAGVVVHNSKDAADAITGAVYNASLSHGVKATSGYVGHTNGRPVTGNRPSSKRSITI
jgi:intein/homing endonuclease